VVNSRTPRHFSEQEVRFLQLMANQAAIAMETARLREEEAARRSLDAELALAREIQRTMMPRAPLDVPGWEVATVYRAAEEVGGDFYDVIDLPGAARRIGLLLGDVAGKSVSGALLMTLSLTAVREAILRTHAPAAVLSEANARIVMQIRADRFVSAFFGVLDPASGSLRYANAGQCYPLVWRTAQGEIEELTARGIILGVMPDPVLEERTVSLERGDVLVLYSDGVTEALNARRSLFGEERLRGALARGAAEGARGVVRRILHDVEAFTRQAAASDDLTLVVVSRAVAPGGYRVAK
jgi:sigma-B regulation protein RsbU (phosphoserine phosphatase)